uniref:hypothetical protein n=1 Tax=Castellaniella defragrans TaxID=75697 RepID=UPI0033415F2F
MSITAVVTALILMPLGILFFGVAEYEDLSGANPHVWTVFPSAALRLDLPDLCEAPRYSRRLFECGGICGENLDIRFGSRTLDDHGAVVLMARAGAATGAAETRLRKEKGASAAPHCSIWRLTLTYDYWK